jgi:hypothetical protein
MRQITLLVLAVLAFSACTVNESPTEVGVFSQTYTVEQNHWKLAHDNNLGDYFYYEFKEPALTRYIYDNGIMNAYLKIDDNLYPLPFDDYWMENSGYRWTEQVTCEFRPGYITFILKYNDYNLDEPPHFPYTFLLRLMW